jgi:hypothetical protein
MSTGRSLVHVGRSNRSVTIRDIHKVLNSFIVGDGMFGQTVDVDTKSFRLTDFQSTLWSLFRIEEKILDFLRVDLTTHELDLIALFGVSVSINTSENLLTSLRNNTSILTITCHTVRFTRSSLTIGE